MTNFFGLSVVISFSLVCVHPASADPAWRVDTGVRQSRLSAGLRDWRETFVAVSRPLTSGWSTSLGVEVQERFGERDLYSEFRIDRSILRGSFYVAAGGTPRADFRPEIAIKAGGAIDLAARSNVTRLTVDADASRFASGEILSVKFGLVHVFTQEGWSGAIQAIAVGEPGGPASVGFAVRTEIPLTPLIRAAIAYTDAPEPTARIATHVEGWSGGVRFDATDTMLIRLDATREDRGTHFRDEVSAGVAYRF